MTPFTIRYNLVARSLPWLVAMLLGSENLDDYPRNVVAVRSYSDNYVDRSLIAGENLRNVSVSHVIATGTSKTGCSITGLPGYPIENVSLSDLNLGFDGGGTKADSSREIPELPERYPESGMFGVLPAYGLYCRHVKNLKLDNVQLRTAEPDLRHALVCEDVAALWLDGLDSARPRPGGARTHVTRCHPLRLSRDTRDSSSPDAALRACRRGGNRPWKSVGVCKIRYGDKAAHVGTTRRRILRFNGSLVLNEVNP